MSGYVLSPRAQADLDEIWEYTAERWDEDQANRYILDIRDAISSTYETRSKR
jgi:toxin ParE1/3/4